ncbi:MAG: hypothetical protein JSS99_01425 [Actinobacteria bacterium]|nr:hypothetical protein [Actinomycetota bacterium]
MPLLSSNITLNDVRRVHRPQSIGHVYRAELSFEELFHLIHYNRVQYSPRYQRGFSKREDRHDLEFDQLLSITDDRAQIDPRRSEEMAMKFLTGRLYSVNIVWNARRDDDADLRYDPERHTLDIDTAIVVPDTAHRHLFGYKLVLWKKDPERVPARISIFEGSMEFGREEIWDLLDDFEPADTYLFCDVYNVTAEQEGELYDEFNSEAKKPSSATAIAQYEDKTPARRLMRALMERTSVLGRDEIETRFNTIAAKSRKLTTNATIVAAIKGMVRGPRDLAALEADTERWNDLIEFFDQFFLEWAGHFPEFEPGTDYGPRQTLRTESFALSNIIMHPLFKLAYDLWSDYDRNDEDWRLDPTWKDALARLSGKVTVTDPETDKQVTVKVMDRDNPEWRERILVPRYGPEGIEKWELSSTRQTRAAAYAYLRDAAGLEPLTVGRTRIAV